MIHHPLLPHVLDYCIGKAEASVGTRGLALEPGVPGDNGTRVPSSSSRAEGWQSPSPALPPGHVCSPTIESHQGKARIVASGQVSAKPFCSPEAFRKGRTILAPWHGQLEAAG